MKSLSQSPQSALKERDAWIAQNLDSAAQQYQMYGDTSAMSNPTNSWLTPFADALHTITDLTSPAHMQNGVPISWPSFPNAFKHGDSSGSIETWNNVSADLMKKNIALIQDAYRKVTGRSCGCRQ